jgi:DNA polymerase-3 subunit gamma/tau
MGTLSRTWQMLFKGLQEVKEAPRPIAAAEMVLVRIAYAADLPPPEEVIRKLTDSATRTAPARGAAAPSPAQVTGEMRQEPLRAEPIRSEPARGEPARNDSARPPLRSEPLRASAQPALAAAAQAPQPVDRTAEPMPAFARFADLIAFVAEKRDLPLKTLLERDVRLVRFEDGKLEVALEPSASRALIADLARKLTALTGRRWMVVVSTEAGEPTLKAQAEARRTEFMAGVQSDPRVQDVLARFPGAQIVAVREADRSLAAAPPASVDDDEPPPDMPPYDDESAFGAHRRPDDVDDDF